MSPSLDVVVGGKVLARLFLYELDHLSGFMGVSIIRDLELGQDVVDFLSFRTARLKELDMRGALGRIVQGINDPELIFQVPNVSFRHTLHKARIERGDVGGSIALLNINRLPQVHLCKLQRKS